MLEYCAIESHVFDLMMPDDLKRLFWADEHGKPDAAVRDAATLEGLSEFVLPVGPLSAAGLHNYYTGEASSV